MVTKGQYHLKKKKQKKAATDLILSHLCDHVLDYYSGAWWISGLLETISNALLLEQVGLKDLDKCGFQGH